MKKTTWTLFYLILALFTSTASTQALTFSTYLGGGLNDSANAITIDSSENIYIVGTTASLSPTPFPTQNPYQADNGGMNDIFVTKMDSDGNLIYSTYIGENGDDRGLGIAIDGSGNIYVTGYNQGGGFPTQNPLQPNNAGGADIVIFKLNGEGSALLYSTYWGGSGDDLGNGIDIDNSGNAYVVGETSSSNFPLLNPFQETYAGNRDALVIKLAHDGSAINYSTFLGGNGADNGNGIKVDTSGSAYVTGRTSSNNFPTQNAFQASYAGGVDVFLTKLNANGTNLVYSTYLGGSASDEGRAVTVDGSGYAYVTGKTASSGDHPFPTQNAYQTLKKDDFDVFVTKVHTDGSALVYSTYLGGNGDEEGRAIVTDTINRAYIAGWSTSTDFPLLNPSQSESAGYYDSFFTLLSSDGSDLNYSTYFGGVGSDYVYGVETNGLGNVYLVGKTNSTIPIEDAFQSLLAGGEDGFVVKKYLIRVESCNGIDDDWDGLVDEGFPDNNGNGITDCLEPELCDGIDNNANGSIDEGFADTDGDGIVDCLDTETCDGMDNNGDGHIDEGFPDADGDGIANCMDEETCDGIDNDGDSLIDEGFPDSDGDGTADCVEVEECNATDDDLDGITDEGCFDIDISVRSHFLSLPTETMLHLDYTINNYSPDTQPVNVNFLIWPYGAAEGMLHTTDLDYLPILAGDSLSGTANIDTDGYVADWTLYGIVAVLYNNADEITATTWLNYDIDWFFTVP